MVRMLQKCRYWFHLSLTLLTPHCLKGTWPWWQTCCHIGLGMVRPESTEPTWQLPGRGGAHASWDVCPAWSFYGRRVRLPLSGRFGGLCWALGTLFLAAAQAKMNWSSTASQQRERFQCLESRRPLPWPHVSLGRQEQVDHLLSNLCSAQLDRTWDLRKKPRVSWSLTMNGWCMVIPNG